MKAAAYSAPLYLRMLNSLLLCSMLCEEGQKTLTIGMTAFTITLFLHSQFFLCFLPQRIKYPYF
jgi:hypothetical protein